MISARHDLSLPYLGTSIFYLNKVSGAESTLCLNMLEFGCTSGAWLHLRKLTTSNMNFKLQKASVLRFIKKTELSSNLKVGVQKQVKNEVYFEFDV